MNKMNVNSPEYRALVSSLLGREVQFQDVPIVSPPQKKKVSSPVYKKSAPISSYKKRTSSPKAQKKKTENIEQVNEDFNQIFKKPKDKKMKEILGFAVEVFGQKGPIVLEVGHDIIQLGEEGRKISNKDILNFFRDMKDILLDRNNLTFMGVQKHPMTGEYLFSWE